MSNVVAVMQRELLSLFWSPIGYIVIAGFWLVTGVLVWATGAFTPGQPAMLRDVFMWTPFVLTLIIPAISMRTLSEEYRTGTIETLMTAPVTDAQMVLGKYFASYIFYLIMIAGTLIYVVLMAIFGSPDWGSAGAAYLGLVLVGLAFTAFGVFASSLTHNQIVAWILGAVPLMLVAWFAYFVVGRVEGWTREILQQINIMGRFGDFARGQVALDGVIFFIAAAFLFVFLTVKVVESRRWR
jgi:ABC-2 type transport system permease protein